jgi:hypothetical protein
MQNVAGPAKVSSKSERKITMLDLPLEYALIEFKGSKFSGKLVPELLDLAERGIVRFIDIVFIQKEKDGSTRTVELNDLEPEAYEMFVPLGKHVGSIFTNDDLEIAARDLKKNSAAMLLLWENLWIANFRKAALAANGKLAARGQIAPEVVAEFKKELAAEERKRTASKQKAPAKSSAKRKTATKKKK